MLSTFGALVLIGSLDCRTLYFSLLDHGRLMPLNHAVLLYSYVPTLDKRRLL